MLPTAIELFAGCGGLSTGLLDAGIQVRLGIDHNRAAMHAYEYNHRHRGSQALAADTSPGGSARPQPATTRPADVAQTARAPGYNARRAISS